MSVYIENSTGFFTDKQDSIAKTYILRNLIYFAFLGLSAMLDT